VLRGADHGFITAAWVVVLVRVAAPIRPLKSAREMGILTVAVVTKPPFEGRKRMQIAEEGIRELSQHVDSTYHIPK